MISERTALWAVSGAIGVTSVGLGAFAMQPTSASPSEQRPAIVVNEHREQPSASPSSTPRPSPSETIETPTAVSPPTAETPD